MSIADRLREAIKSSEKSLAAIGRESGVPQPMLTTFMQGADIRVKTADKLAAYFELDLGPIRTSAKTKLKKEKARRKE